MKCFICKHDLINRSFYIGGKLSDSFSVCNNSINTHSLEKHDLSYYINIIETDKSLEVNLSHLTKFIYITEYSLVNDGNKQRFDMINSFCFKKDEFKKQIYTEIVQMLKKNTSITELMHRVHKYKIFV